MNDGIGVKLKTNLRTFLNTVSDLFIDHVCEIY